MGGRSAERYLKQLLLLQPTAIEAYLMLQRLRTDSATWKASLNAHASAMPPGVPALVLAYEKKHAGDDIGACGVTGERGTARRRRAEIMLTSR